MTAPSLSVVVPAYNEARRLPASLARVRAYLRARGREYEIVVVDDGSSDTTSQVARDAGADVRVLRHEPNRGKGYAVRRGMLAATGARRLITDADLSTPIEELAKLEAEIERGFDVAIGSRAVAGALIEVHQPAYREVMGRLFNRLVQALLLPGLRDTQCGFKLFTDRAAQAAFSVSSLDGFSFDVEALYVARHRGLRIAEVPVTWRNDAATRVGLGGGAAAFADLAAHPPPRAARGLRRPRGNGRRAPHVAHVRALPQLAHPGLDPLVERAALESGAQRFLLVLEGGPGRAAGLLVVPGLAQLVVAHAHLRPEAELHVLEDGDLAPEEPPQVRLLHLRAQGGPLRDEERERAILLLGRDVRLRQPRRLDVHQPLVDRRLAGRLLGEAAHHREGANVAPEQRPLLHHRDDALEGLHPGRGRRRLREGEPRNEGGDEREGARTHSRSRSGGGTARRRRAAGSRM